MTSCIPRNMTDLLTVSSTNLIFGENPHRVNSIKHEVFEKAKNAKNIGEAKQAGASLWDIRGWVTKGSVQVIADGTHGGGDGSSGTMSMDANTTSGAAGSSGGNGISNLATNTIDLDAMHNEDDMRADEVFDEVLRKDPGIFDITEDLLPDKNPIIDSGRLKDRSESFKSRPTSSDAKSESIDQQRLRREEYLEKVRRLEITKERLTPTKSKVPEQAAFDISDGPPIRQPVFEQESEPVTLHAISNLLDKKLAPMNDSMSQLEHKFGELRIQVDKEMQDIKSSSAKKHMEVEDTLKVLHGNVENISKQVITVSKNLTAFESSTISRIEECENAILDMKEAMADYDFNTPGTSANAQKIRALEEELRNIKMQRNAFDGDDLAYLRHEAKLRERLEGMQRTMVIGGLGIDGGKDAATEWVQTKCTEIADCKPKEVFSKGDYKGMLFAKFLSKEQRDTSVQKLRKASPSRDQNRTWFTEDAPVEERQCLAVLFGVKRFLIDEWGYDKFAFWIDKSSMAMYYGINNDYIFSCVVRDSILHIDYGMEWEDFIRDTNLDELVEKANTAISRSRNAKGKKGMGGKGKEDKGGKGKWQGVKGGKNHTW